MKIYCITSKLDFEHAGGSIEQIDLMMRTLIDKGHEVVAVTLFPQYNHLTHALPYRVEEAHDVGADMVGLQRGVLAVMRTYEHDADFFHVDGHLCLYGAGLYRKLGGTTPVSALFNRELLCWPDDVDLHDPLTAVERGFLGRIKKRARFFAEKYIGAWMANGIDLFMFTNPHLRKEYEDFCLRKRSSTIIFGDPLNYAQLMQQNGVTRNSYAERNKKNPPLQLFYSSRMVPGKGFPLLLNAFAKVRNKDDFCLTVGGTGPLAADLKALAASLKIEKWVVFPGWVPREQLFKNYKNGDIFIQPRWRKDLTSISLLYAMAFGVPSILPRGGGLEWDAQGGALYFEEGNADDLAQKIEELGASSELRAALSKKCFERLDEDQMDYKKIIGRWHTTMQEMKAASCVRKKMTLE